MEVQNFIRISHKSRIPKYQQIYVSIKEDVNNGVLEVGSRIPSINELSEQFYVSRDTVEKAYNLLKGEGIIESKKGSGFFIANRVKAKSNRVLFLLNKFSDYKLKTYKAFVNNLGNAVKVDFYVYHCDSELFVNKINECIGQYDRYVIMPHFKNENNLHQNINDRAKKAILQIPPEKLIIMDNKLDDFVGKSKIVYQDFKMDIYYALIDGHELLKKYKKLVLIFSNNPLYPHPQEIKVGFRKFCTEREFDFEILDGGKEEYNVEKGDVFIVIQENDLVNIISQVKKRQFQVGLETGIISYNDTPLKELLGITVISTDFKSMGKTAAGFINSNKKAFVKNKFQFINRGSV